MNTQGQHWLKHSICVHPFRKIEEPDEYGRMARIVHDHFHTIKVFDYPSWITKKWSWYITYWMSKMQIRFPRYQISHHVCGYWPEAEADSETIKKRQIAAAKGQISKVLSIIEDRKKELSLQLFQDETNDQILT